MEIFCTSAVMPSRTVAIAAALRIYLQGIFYFLKLFTFYV